MKPRKSWDCIVIFRASWLSSISFVWHLKVFWIPTLRKSFTMTLQQVASLVYRHSTIPYTNSSAFGWACSIKKGSPVNDHQLCCIALESVWFLYWTLSPVIQYFNTPISSSLAPTTCISFLVSSSERFPPALVNLKSTFTCK